MKRKEGATDHLRESNAGEVKATGTKPYTCTHVRCMTWHDICNLNSVHSKDSQTHQVHEQLKQMTMTVFEFMISINQHRLLQFYSSVLAFIKNIY